MSAEAFDGGVFYKSAIDPITAARCGRVVSAFRRYSRSSFFKPPMNDVHGSNSRVLKAWLSYPEGEKAMPSLRDDFGAQPNQAPEGWGALGVQKLITLADTIDILTQTPSDTRFLQSYPPGSVLVKHDDRGKSSRIVGLDGVGEFYIYDQNDHERIVNTIEVGPGDVLHFFGNGLHSAANTSSARHRETINLIDA